MTIKMPENRKQLATEKKPHIRHELDVIIDRLFVDDLDDILNESSDLNIQLSALTAMARYYDLDELDEYRSEVGHIFKTFIGQLEKAVAPLEDNSESGEGLKIILLSLLLTEMEANHGQSKSSSEQQKWQWPVLTVPPSKVPYPGFAEDWNEVSPLKMFGYTVGRSSGWNAQTRKRFLDDFMTYDLPNIVTETYGDYYGDPNSAQRLKAIAQLLASLIISAKRKRGNSMRYAIDDWTSDLQYLKSVYYEGKGLKFYSWPTTTPS